VTRVQDISKLITQAEQNALLAKHPYFFFSSVDVVSGLYTKSMDQNTTEVLGC